jgi:hypothetical protein
MPEYDNSRIIETLEAITADVESVEAGSVDTDELGITDDITKALPFDSLSQSVAIDLIKATEAVSGDSRNQVLRIGYKMGVGTSSTEIYEAPFGAALAWVVGIDGNGEEFGDLVLVSQNSATVLGSVKSLAGIASRSYSGNSSYNLELAMGSGSVNTATIGFAVTPPT